MRLEYFQLIDQIVDLRPQDGLIQTRATVPAQSTIFEGHFPGHPLMPGVLLIESMAQSSGYLILGANGFGGMPFLAGVREAKFRTFVSPGQILDVEAELEHDGSGFAMTKAKIAHEGKPVCDARLTFRVMAFPAPEFRTMMIEQASRLGYAQEPAA